MAGGEGRRLKAVTGDLPKPMAPFLGKPVMARIVDLLRENGITELCAALRYHPRPITDYFGDGSRFGVHLEYRLEDIPLGTAGGVKNCADFTGGEDVLVISGDAICDFDLRRLVREHRAAPAAATLALYESADPLRYGLVLPDAEGRVRAFIEKPAWERVVTNLVNTGLYVLSPAALDAIPPGVPCDFARDLFPRLLSEGQILRSAVMEGYWCDVGTPRAYCQCCLDALDGRVRLPDIPLETPAPEPTPARAPLAGPRTASRRLPCRDRAALMRVISETMLETGADYADGVTLGGARCGLRISPDPAGPALLIETASRDAEFSEALALSMEDLARALEQRLTGNAP